MREQKEDCKMARFGELICICDVTYIFIDTVYIFDCYTYIKNIHRIHGSLIFSEMMVDFYGKCM